MQQPAVAYAADNLGFTYTSGELRFRALSDINFTIHKGEFVAITGASGSGKSTLMNLLGLLAKPTDGLLSVTGEEVGGLSDDELASLRNRKIGFVFQQFHLLPRLTVLENVLLPIHYMDPRPDAGAIERLQGRALTLLEGLGVMDQKDKRPALLSGGQKQRVAIARALLCDPDIILADEPTGALDSSSSEEVLRIFSELHRQGRTVVVITHDPEVMRVAHRNIILKDGALTEDADVRDRRLVGPQDGAAGHPALRQGQVQAAGKSLSWFQRAAGRLRMMTQPMLSVLQSLVSSKLRTFLTSLGLIIGVSSIIIMITLGQAAQNVILGIFHEAGTDRVYLGLDYREVRTGKYSGYWEGLDIRRDIPAIQSVFEKHAEVVPLVGWMRERVGCLGGSTFDARLQGLYSRNDLLDRGVVLDKGRLFTPAEFESGARVAVIGSDFAEKLFPLNFEGRVNNPQFPVGEMIFTKNQLYTSLTIIGVLKKKDSPFGDDDVNEMFYLPVNTYIKSANDKNVTWIAAKPKPGVDHRWLADSIVNYLTLMTGQRYPFKSEVPEEAISKVMMFIAVFQGLTTLIGALCIIVGGIGIMNIMLVTIAERVREIGLRKALGARPRNITWQFLMECVLLCFISGLIGLVVGLGFSNLVGFFSHLAMPDKVPAQFIFSSAAVVAGITTAVVCGLAFGMMPALKASKLDPSDALRSE